MKKTKILVALALSTIIMTGGLVADVTTTSSDKPVLVARVDPPAV